MKKSQIWYMDLIISIVIVILFVSIFLYTLSNRTTKSNDSLIDHASYISEILMSQGSPINWDENNVRRPGIIKENWRVDVELLEKLYSLDISKMRQVFNSEKNFVIEVFNGTNVMSFSLKNYTGRRNPNPNQISSISRYALYENDVIEVRVSVWE